MVSQWNSLYIFAFCVFLSLSAFAAPLPGSAEEDVPYINLNETTTTVEIPNTNATETKLVEKVITDSPAVTTLGTVGEAVAAETQNGGDPEFEDRPDNIDGDKAGEVDQKESETTAPKEPPVEIGEGEVQEDVVPDQDNTNTDQLVEESKGNIGTPKSLPVNQKLPIDAPDSNFLTFIVVATLLVVCIYIIQHNKKKILGLMFEGRTGRNVRYRRLSQHEDESYREDIIY